MGLIINATNNKKIILDGTNIELPFVYARVEFAARLDGKTCDVAYVTFVNKQMYESGKIVSTDMPQQNIQIQLSQGQEQTIHNILLVLQEIFNNLGYHTLIE